MNLPEIVYKQVGLICEMFTFLFFILKIILNKK